MGERVMVEYAQPNTHHSFHIGHARNAILGESVARLAEFAGFETIRASYPGDIGLGVITILWAYERFYRGQEPTGLHERGQWLLDIYAEATALLTEKEGETAEEKKRREQFESERREMYRRWDAGDPELIKLWRRTRQWSLEELDDILRLLDIKIDVFFFESEVDKPSKAIVEELIARGIAEDERPQGGPVIVKIDERLGLKKEKYRVAVILRSDGTTLYATKDLALAKVKFEKYNVDRSVYVVDVRQSLHFQQVFKILELWGFPQARNCYHLAYGFVTLPEGAMSARKGNVVFFKDVADEAHRRVQAVIAEKNPSLNPEERQQVARAVGLGAIAYAKNELEQTKLAVRSAQAEEKAANAGADLGRKNNAERDQHAAELGQRAAEAKMAFLKAKRAWLKRHIRFTEHNIYAAEARYHLEKAKVASAKNIRPSGFQLANFEKQARQRSEAMQRARLAADDEKKRAEGKRQDWNKKEQEYMTAKGIKGVALYPAAPASFVSRTPIRTPDDLKGKKFRVLATPIESAMMAAMGATGVPMPWGDTLPALQQGAVDGVEAGLTVLVIFKYFDVVKWHTNTDHYIIHSTAIVSKKWLDGLPAELQKAVVEEGPAVHAELLPWTKNFYEEGVKLWKDKTKEGWIELTAEQRAAFRARMQGVDEKVAAQVPGVKEWLDLLRAKSKQYAR